jgi:hypothetical protein
MSLEIHQQLKTMCSLSTRELQPTISLPERIQPAPHMEIINPHLFITTALHRLESDSPRLRGVAERALKAVIKALENG